MCDLPQLRSTLASTRYRYSTTYMLVLSWAHDGVMDPGSEARARGPGRRAGRAARLLAGVSSPLGWLAAAEHYDINHSHL